MKMRIIVLAALLLMFPFRAHAYEGGDTGTYRILVYTVSVAPGTDGQVTIDYYQKWQVTGGHIPWITVGTPNSNYTILNSSNAVSKISAADRNDWSGVRVDLDKDYTSGQSFEVHFTILDSEMLSEVGGRYQIEYTPGWYDRAPIDLLKIAINNPTRSSDVHSMPSPDASRQGWLQWSKKGLAPGERFPIKVSFPKSAFPAVSTMSGQGAGPRETGSPTGGSAMDYGIMAGVAIGIIGAIIAIIRFGHTGGGDSLGGYTGGWISRGGMGGCACACAGCACACACAGGGGAGCSRKEKHSCMACRTYGMASDE
jgi:hypothetical protein